MQPFSRHSGLVAPLDRVNAFLFVIPSGVPVEDRGEVEESLPAFESGTGNCRD
jgi:hypothetical protein